MELVHLKTRIFNTPLAIDPEKLQVLLSGIGHRIGIGDVDIDPLIAAKFSKPASQKSYTVTPDGVAIIPISGTLMKKSSPLMSALSGTASYDEITSQFQGAVN